MPTYVYKFVDTGETIEVQQGFHDENLTEYAHPDTGETMSVKKVFTPVGVTFKGSGFFKTDNRGSTSKPTKKDDGATSGGSDSAAASGGSDSKPASSGSGDTSSSSSASSTSSSGGSSAGSSTPTPASD